jgi:hypothetical protein
MPAGPRTALPSVRTALPAAGGQSRIRPDEQAPPWELAPGKYAAAPLAPEFPDWSPSSTGPMYVWNPATATGPQPILPGDAAAEDKNQELAERAVATAYAPPSPASLAFTSDAY